MKLTTTELLIWGGVAAFIAYLFYQQSKSQSQPGAPAPPPYIPPPSVPTQPVPGVGTPYSGGLLLPPNPFSIWDSLGMPGL